MHLIPCARGCRLYEKNRKSDSLFFLIMSEISLCDVSGISTKAPCEVALVSERHVRIEISDFAMRTFVPM